MLLTQRLLALGQVLVCWLWAGLCLQPSSCQPVWDSSTMLLVLYGSEAVLSFLIVTNYVTSVTNVTSAPPSSATEPSLTPRSTPLPRDAFFSPPVWKQTHFSLICARNNFKSSAEMLHSHWHQHRAGCARTAKRVLYDAWMKSLQMNRTKCLQFIMFTVHRWCIDYFFFFV